MNIGNYDTEEEAGYAYNVATVLMAPVVGEPLLLADLNLGIELTLAQARHVEDTVTAIVRKEIGLPRDYKFPLVAKNFLAQTCKIK